MLPVNDLSSVYQDLVRIGLVLTRETDLDMLLERILTEARRFTGAEAVWPSLGGPTKAGQGVIVGVIDTGVWPEHPSFADPGIDRPAGRPAVTDRIEHGEDSARWLFVSDHLRLSEEVGQPPVGHRGRGIAWRRPAQRLPVRHPISELDDLFHLPAQCRVHHRE